MRSDRFQNGGLEQLMSNPTLRNMAERFQSGGGVSSGFLAMVTGCDRLTRLFGVQ